MSPFFVEILPRPRSGFSMAVHENALFIYGGYSKEKINKYGEAKGSLTLFFSFPFYLFSFLSFFLSNRCCAYRFVVDELGRKIIIIRENKSIWCSAISEKVSKKMNRKISKKKKKHIHLVLLLSSSSSSSSSSSVACPWLLMVAK
jgi:hypothetical protein